MFVWFQTSAGVLLPPVLPNQCDSGLPAVWLIWRKLHRLYGHHHPPPVM